MQKWKIALVALMLCVSGHSIAQISQDSYDAQVKRYIQQYKDLAIREQKRCGVPACITLAQGIHETVAGTSELATQANNHFGIKCKKEWTGETFSHTDDAPDECFRKYSCADESYKDHSTYLTTSKRYADLFKLDPANYQGWAYGLKRCGYATNPKYAPILIKLIEDYHLQDYTMLAMATDTDKKRMGDEVVPAEDAEPLITSRHIVVSSPAPDARKEVPVYGKVVKVNGLKAVYAKKGDMPLEYAVKNGLRYERFLEMNDIDEKPLPADMYLYLEKKNYKGVNETHVVSHGETLLQVAQAEGMQLKSLRAFNKLLPREEPQEGTVLELQKAAMHKPAIVQSAAMSSSDVLVKSNPNSRIRVINDYVETKPVVVEAAPEAAVPEVIDPTKEEDKTAITKAEAAPEQPISAPERAPEMIAQNTVPVSEPVIAVPVKTEAQPEIVNANTAPAVVNTEAISVPSTATTEKATTLESEQKPADEAVVGPPAAASEVPANSVKGYTPAIAQAQPAKIEEAKKEEAKLEEPKSDLDILKSRFDKVVYAKPSTPAPEVKKEESKPEQKTEIIAANEGGAKFYTVKRGDTAFNIAKTHNITMKQLQEWNNLDFGEIKTGQKLRVRP